MSGYLGRLLQATARGEQRLHPMAGTVYSERAAAIEQSVGPELGAPQRGALHQPEGEQTLASWSPPDPRDLGSVELSSRSILRSSAGNPPDAIRTTTATEEPSGPAPTMRERDDAYTGATRIDGWLHSQLPRSETFAARADDATGKRTAAIAMDQDSAPTPDAFMVRQAVPSVAAGLKIRQPTRDQNFASKVYADEPEVQVHIGRIEVLAVQPQPPATPAPRRETATRLADYLAARNGSSR
jgi:hypothetical protein